MNDENLQEMLYNRKINIVRLLTSLFLFVSLITLINYILRAIEFNEINYLILIINTLLLCIFVFLYFYYIKKRLIFSFFVIWILFVAVSVIVMLQAGTQVGISFLLFVTIILSSSIVVSVKFGFITFITLSLLTSLVYILHHNSIISYTPSPTTSRFVGTSVMIFFIFIIFNISRIGYGELYHWYMKSLNYSKQLKKFNEELEDIVDLRTEQLQETFNERVISVQKAVVMGSIAKPLIHDIANPASVLKGSLRILQKNVNLSKSDKEVLEIVDKASDQIVRIIENAKLLMANKPENSSISIKTLINDVIFILRSELNATSIKLKIDMKKDFEIIGSKVLMERIVINLLLNSIQELRHKKNNRQINISLNKVKDKIQLIIMDNGRGIEKQDFERIFDDGYSTKKYSQNLGLGLSFVKEIIVKHFNSEIILDSKKGKYTKFIILLNVPK